MALLDLAGIRHELPVGETIVGSGAAADWRLQKLDLGARHLVISLADDGHARVRPATPQDVVTVNRRQVSVQGCTLRDGDVIAAGTARFVFAHTAAALDALAPVTQPAELEPAASPAYLIDTRAALAYPLTRRSATLGRDAASLVQIRDPVVSRFHADVRAEAGELVLYPLGSAGTKVNGYRIGSPRVLEEGDRIEIGHTELLFTRLTLPAGTVVADSGEPRDEELSRLPTGLHPVYSPEVVARGRRMPVFPIVVAVAAAVVVIWLLFS